MAVGGAAYLVARAIKASKVIGFEDLGMEAIYEFTVQDMPVTVAVDSTGENVHVTAPTVWKRKIAEEGLLQLRDLAPGDPLAGLFQAWRTAVQQPREGGAPVNAAGLVRYLFGFPIACLLLVTYLLFATASLPGH